MNEATAEKKKVGDGKLGMNLICGAGSHLISAGIAFFLTPFLIQRLGIEMYGFYPIALEAMAVFGLAMGLLNSTAGRYIAVEYAGGRKREAKEYFSTVFFSGVLFVLFLLIPLAIFIVFCNTFLDMPIERTGEIKLFLLLMLLSGLTDSVSAVFGASYETSNRLDFRAAQEVFAVFVKALLLWFLLSGIFPISIVSVGVAVFISSAVSAVVRFFMARVLTPDILPARSFFSLTACKRVLASGTWYSLNELGGWLTGGGFLILVSVGYGAADAGVYSLALTASRVFGGVMMMLAGVFIPTAVRRFAKGEREALIDEIIKGEKMIGFFALVGVSMTVGFLREFFEVWLGEQNTLSLRLLTVFAVVPMLSVSCALPFFNLAVVMNRLKKMSLLYVSEALFGFAATLVLVVFSNVGILGVAAVAFAVRLFWYSIFMPFFAARLLGTEPIRLIFPILKTYVGATVSIGIILALKSLCRISSVFSLILVMAVSFCSVLVVGFFTVYGKLKTKI